MNCQFKAKYENDRASLGEGKVTLSFRAKTTRAAELQRRFSSQHRQVEQPRLWCWLGKRGTLGWCTDICSPSFPQTLWPANMPSSSLWSVPHLLHICRGLSPGRQYIHPIPGPVSTFPHIQHIGFSPNITQDLKIEIIVENKE